MFSTIKKLASAFHIPSNAELEEAYLNDAADGYDLEYRMRQIDRGNVRFQ
ncbi:Protein of unknown function [Cohaesibacter sp. ES.047]|nr:DUF3563 family protein [Cohaesibacter sp. ES.047]SNY93781.1 Protein of unknown function [Cohaesibacter sp. ES.047]